MPINSDTEPDKPAIETRAIIVDALNGPVVA